jgi:hypothetical protein
MSVSSNTARRAGGVTIQTDWRGVASNDTNAVQPRNSPFQLFEIRKSKHRNTAVEPGSELILFLYSPPPPFTTRTAEIRGRLEEPGGRRVHSYDLRLLKYENEWPKENEDEIRDPASRSVG